MTVVPASQSSFPVGKQARILHLHYPTRYALCASFMRLQEFYESDIPGIRGNFFTLEEFMDAYAARMGNFTYTVDWGGFNVPGPVYRAWREAFPACSLLGKEKALADSVDRLLAEAGNPEAFYLVGSSADTGDVRAVVAHEVAHALFALLPGYRKEQLEHVQAWKASDPAAWERISGKLLDMGYVDSVLPDEVQAYLSTADDKDLDRHFGFKVPPERKSFTESFRLSVEANGIGLPPASPA
jgi:hypothetical protein